MTKASILLAFMIVGLLGAFGWATAQGPASPDTITRKDIVIQHLIVTDHSDHAVDTLRREDVQIFEDGKPQQLVSFEKEVLPARYAIAIDTSLSFKPLLGTAAAAVASIINHNQPQDQTALISFVSSDKIERLVNFTPDQFSLIDGLKNLRPEEGQSAVVDGVYMAAQATADYQGEPQSRRAVVLVSDGEERRSYYKTSDLIKLLHEHNIQVFAIGFVGALESESGFIKMSPREKAETLLRTLAQETGGRVFFPQNPGELQHAAEEIVHDLHSQFVIAYQSANTNKKGSHKIQVKIASAGKDKLTGITRPSRSVGSNKPAKNDQKKDQKKGNP